MDVPNEADDALLIDCVYCQGLGFKVTWCACRLDGTEKGDRVDAAPKPGEALTDCRVCAGKGSTVKACLTCQEGGKLRAQMVLTAINLDTAAIASATIIPGVIDPVPQLREGEPSGRFELPLRPILDDLVDRVGGTLLESVSNQGPGPLERAKPIGLYPPWAPGLPPEQKQLAIAQILTKQQARRRSVFFTSHTKPTETNAEAALAKLCRLTDAMHLDLRIFYCRTEGMRSQSRQWAIDVALADEANLTHRPLRAHSDLRSALTNATGSLATLINDLRFRRSPEAVTPAYQIRTTESPGTDPGPVAEIDAAISGIDGDGAIGIWREGRWHYSALMTATANERFHTAPTGRVHRLVDHLWRIQHPPPVPDYWAHRIPERVCSDCQTGAVWHECSCVDTLDQRPSVDCRICAGSGWRTVGDCARCGNLGRIRYGFTVTVTDLESFTRHIGYTAPVPADHRQLPERQGLTHALFEIGVDLADVTAFDGLPPSSTLLEGAAPPWLEEDPDTPTHRFTAAVSRGYPGARLFLRLKPPFPAAAGLQRLIQIAVGLGSDLVIAVHDRSEQANAGTTASGTRWAAAFLDPNQPVELGTMLLRHRHLSAAVTDTTERLPHLLNITGRPRPSEPIAAPQQLTAPPVDVSELESVLSALAGAHAGIPLTTITARIGAGRCRIVLHPARSGAWDSPPRTLADKSDIAGAVAALRPSW